REYPPFFSDRHSTQPRFIRTTVDDARSWAQVYTIYDGDLYEHVAATQIPAGPLSNPSMPAASGVANQMVEVAAHEHAVATGGGPVAQEYAALQVHRN
ncbi:hypothetical protein BDW02DRAFT_164779, partial [Decorospora gaudefroyi]